MRISEVIWLDTVVDKLARKHAVRADEVEEVLRNQPKFASQRREIAQARTFTWR